MKMPPPLVPTPWLNDSLNTIVFRSITLTLLSVDGTSVVVPQ